MRVNNSIHRLCRMFFVSMLSVLCVSAYAEISTEGAATAVSAAVSNIVHSSDDNSGGGAGGGSGLNSNIKIEIGSSKATLSDGSEVDMRGTPYASPAENPMVPVRGLAIALGLKSEDILYDTATKTATFFLPNGGVVQIQVGNDQVTVDGVKTPLKDANGNSVTPEIKNGGIYMPMQAAAQSVFGVAVNYNSSNRTAVLNPS